MRPRRGVLKWWRKRSAGQVGVDVAGEYVVHEAKRRDHEALIVDVGG